MLTRASHTADVLQPCAATIGSAHGGFSLRIVMVLALCCCVFVLGCDGTEGAAHIALKFTSSTTGLEGDCCPLDQGIFSDCCTYVKPPEAPSTAPPTPGPTTPPVSISWLRIGLRIILVGLLLCCTCTWKKIFQRSYLELQITQQPPEIVGDIWTGAHSAVIPPPVASIQMLSRDCFKIICKIPENFAYENYDYMNIYIGGSRRFGQQVLNGQYQITTTGAEGKDIEIRFYQLFLKIVQTSEFKWRLTFTITDDMVGQTYTAGQCLQSQAVPAVGDIVEVVIPAVGSIVEDSRHRERWFGAGCSHFAFEVVNACFHPGCREFRGRKGKLITDDSSSLSMAYQIEGFVDELGCSFWFPKGIVQKATTCDGTWVTTFGEIQIVGETGTYLGIPGNISSINWLSPTKIEGFFYNANRLKGGHFRWTFDGPGSNHFAGVWWWDDGSPALPAEWDGCRISHDDAFELLNHGDRVRALPGRSLKDYFNEGDEGTVTKLEHFDGSKPHFHITWDQSGKTISIETTQQAIWVKKVGKGLARVVLEDARKTLGSSKLEAKLKKHKGQIEEWECKVYEEECKTRKEAELELQDAYLEPGCSVLEEALRKHEHVHVDKKSYLDECERRKAPTPAKSAWKCIVVSYLFVHFMPDSLSALFILISAGLTIVDGDATALAEQSSAILLYVILYYVMNLDSYFLQRVMIPQSHYRTHQHLLRLVSRLSTRMVPGCIPVVVAGGMALAHLGPHFRAIVLIVVVLGLWSLQLRKSCKNLASGRCIRSFWSETRHLMISFVAISASIWSRNVPILAFLVIVLAVLLCIEHHPNYPNWMPDLYPSISSGPYLASVIILIGTYYPQMLRYVIVSVTLGAALALLSSYRNVSWNVSWHLRPTVRLTVQTVLLTVALASVVSASAFGDGQKRNACAFGAIYLATLSLSMSIVSIVGANELFLEWIDLALVAGVVAVIPCVTSPSIAMTAYAAIVGTDILALYGPSVLSSLAPEGDQAMCRWRGRCIWMANWEMVDKPLEFRSLADRLILRNAIMVAAWSVNVVVFVAHALASGNGDLVLGGAPEAQQASLRIRWLLLLPDKVPLYLNFLLATVKPIIMTAIFGVPQTDKDAIPPRFRLYFMSRFVVVITVVAFLADIRNVAIVMLDDTLSAWQQYCGINIALAVSSNLQTAFAFITLTLNYLASEAYVASKAFAKMRKLQGSLWFWCMCFVALVYLSLVLVMAVALFIAFAFYFWVLVPLAAIVYGYSLFLERQLRDSNENGCIGRCLKASGAGDRFAIDIDKEAEQMIEDAKTRYNEQLTSAQDSGIDYHAMWVHVSNALQRETDRVNIIAEAKKSVLKLTPLTPMLGAMIPFIVPICMRWFMGVGYFTAFDHTFHDRNMTAFSKSMISRANHTVVYVMQVADKYHAGPVATICYILTHWLQTLNYIL